MHFSDLRYYNREAPPHDHVVPDTHHSHHVISAQSPDLSDAISRPQMPSDFLTLSSTPGLTMSLRGGLGVRGQGQGQG